MNASTHTCFACMKLDANAVARRAPCIERGRHDPDDLTVEHPCCSRPMSPCRECATLVVDTSR